MGQKDPTQLSFDFALLTFEIAYSHLKFTLSTRAAVNCRSLPTVVNYVPTAFFSKGMRMSNFESEKSKILSLGHP
jgi:hypothetical protein